MKYSHYGLWICRDFTIMEKGPTRAFSWLKAPTSNTNVTRNRQFSQHRFLKPPVSYDCVGVPISHLLTVFRRPFRIVSYSVLNVKAQVGASRGLLCDYKIFVNLSFELQYEVVSIAGSVQEWPGPRSTRWRRWCPPAAPCCSSTTSTSSASSPSNNLSTSLLFVKAGLYSQISSFSATLSRYWSDTKNCLDLEYQLKMLNIDLY